MLTRPLKSYPNFIEGIRFPLYKKLKPNLDINFSYPFTALVGPNGCGKTSVLHALFGCPIKQSTSQFWFSTAMDPIVEGDSKSPNRYIYRYTPSHLSSPVEVLKIRRARAGNPDYWEPDKPRKQDGMLALPEKISKKDMPYRSASRWNPVKKNVVYIDFRSEISAFDKFFNFGTFTKGKTINSKQDYLRVRSKALLRAINNSFYTYRGRKVQAKYQLDDVTLKVLSKILNKAYSEAFVVEHNLFDAPGFSIIFKDKLNRYSEAVAGSGEVAIASAVLKVMNAPKGSLILMDEPEVSLHPAAQKELRAFLLEKINTEGHQIIVSTHSRYFIDELPRGAIKVFYQTPNGDFDVINDASSEQAFVRIGETIDNKKEIFVEDELMKLLVERAVKIIDEDLLNTIDVKVLPGGGPQIKQTILSDIAVTGSQQRYALLDGDQKLQVTKIETENLTSSDLKNLDQIIVNYIGCDVKFPLDGGNKPNTEQKIKYQLAAIEAYNSKFYFCNTEIPEELIWNSTIHIVPTLSNYDSEPDYKKKFIKLTCDALDTDDVTSSDILHEQKRLLSKMSGPLWNEFINTVRQIVTTP